MAKNAHLGETPKPPASILTPHLTPSTLPFNSPYVSQNINLPSELKRAKLQNLAAKSQLNISEIMFDSLPLKQKNLFIKKNSEQIKKYEQKCYYTTNLSAVTIAARAGCFFLREKEAIWNEK